MKAMLPLLALVLAGCATVPPAAAGPVAGLGQTAEVSGVRIRPLALVEDSRCPRDVQCVWAGRLIILAEIDFNGGGESFRGNLTLSQPLPLGSEIVTLVAASPDKTVAAAADPRAYRFTFTVQTRP